MEEGKTREELRRTKRKRSIYN